MKLKRLIKLLSVTLVLGLALALTAMAAELADFVGTATGKDGKITVPDNTKKYVISFVTLKDEEITTGYNDTGFESVAEICDDSWRKLNADTNQGLSGLYKICEADENDKPTSKASYVYVNGLVADAKNIAKNATGAYSAVGSKWGVGKMITVGDNTEYITDNEEEGYVSSKHEAYAIARVFGDDYKNIYFSSGWQNPGVLLTYTYDNDNSTDGLEVTKELVAEAFGEYSTKYALTAKEIIPATSFNSFTYGVQLVWGSVWVTDNLAETKLQVVVYNVADGEVYTYEAVDDVKANLIRDTTEITKHTITADELTLVGGTTKLSDLGDDSYIMGYEIFPAVNVTGDNISYSNATSNVWFNTYIYYDEYDIELPKGPAPTGITYDYLAGELTGLDSSKEYYLATYTLDGANTDLNGDGTPYDFKLEGIVDGKVALTDDAPAGLVAVVAKGDAYTAESAPVIFYTPTKKAGHFNSVLNNSGLVAENTTKAGYYGKVGQLTYNQNSILDGVTFITEAGTGATVSSTVRPYMSSDGFAYAIAERKYIKTGETVGEYDLYEEGDLFEGNYALENVAFYYGFESDEAFFVQDFAGFTVPSAKFLQGYFVTYAVKCEAEDAGATETYEGSGEYYRLVSGINSGASFKSVITLFYLDLTDNTMKSVDIESNLITREAQSISFVPNSSISSLNGYVLGFALKPYQSINKNGHETIFAHTLNFGDRCYWGIGEDADGNAMTNMVNSLSVNEHGYDGERPQGMIGYNGSFTTENMAEYANRYFQAAPLELSADGNTMVTGKYGDVFQLSNASLNSGFSGLWMVRFSNAEGTAGSAPSDIVYFSGTNEDKAMLGDIKVGSGEPVINFAANWQSGVWAGGIDYISGAEYGAYYGLSSHGAPITSLAGGSVDNAGLAQHKIYKGTQQEKEAAQATVTAEVNAHSNKYAYQSEEIIPAKDFLSFTYKTGLRMGDICLAAEGSDINKNTKLVVYVANPDRTITKYEATVNEPTMKIGKDKGLSNNIVVTASDLLNGANAINTSDGYVVGVEIFPVQIVDSTEIYVEDPTWEGGTLFYNNSFNVEVTYGDYAFRIIPETPKFNVENALPADKIAGEDKAYATITGLIPSYRYEMMVDINLGDVEGNWVDLPYYNNGEYEAGTTGAELHESEYSIKVPVDTNEDKTETYMIRVKGSELTTASAPVQVTVYYLEGPDYEFASLENEERIINLASDFIEVQADYTIDLIAKPWIQNIALNNLKVTSPKAIITFEGDGFKFVVRAEDVNIDRTVHYYNFNIAMNGSGSRDFYFDKLKELAGDSFVAEYMLDSLNDLPFTKVDFYIYVGEEYNGKTLELHSYYDDINRLRKKAESEVEDGWVSFNLYDQAYVICEE